MMDEKVVQPLLVTTSALTLATECVKMIMKVRVQGGDGREVWLHLQVGWSTCTAHCARCVACTQLLLTWGSVTYNWS